MFLTKQEIKILKRYRNPTIIRENDQIEVYLLKKLEGYGYFTEDKISIDNNHLIRTKSLTKYGKSILLYKTNYIKRIIDKVFGMYW